MEPGPILVAAAPHELTIEFADGGVVHCNRFWLRDNCPANGDRASLFRSFSVATMTDDLEILRADLDGGEIEIEFSDGVVDRSDPVVLRRWLTPPAGPAELETWHAGFTPAEFALDEVDAESASHHALLEAIVRHGVAVVTGLPTSAPRRRSRPGSDRSARPTSGGSSTS